MNLFLTGLGCVGLTFLLPIVVMGFVFLWFIHPLVCIIAIAATLYLAVLVSADSS